MVPLPTGTVTFVFTDIEGSTSMLQRIGSTAFESILDDHHRLIRRGFTGGVEVRTEGDAFFFAFSSAPAAVTGAVRAQQLLSAHDWPAGGNVRVRMGLHTGEGRLGAGDYIGLDVHRAARIASAGHGGQILISGDTEEAARPGLSEDIILRDLGAHHFKDLEHPEQVFQANAPGVPSDHPPIRSLEERPNNLPGQVSAFVGRERETAEVADLLGRARLVTLTGPGGTGKTRLALRVASDVLTRFGDGVTFVSLQPLRDATLVTSAIASALGLDAGNRPPLEVVIDRVRDKGLLLVLDNFEHVLDAATEVAAILARAPDVRVLVTSQALLRVTGEQAFLVPPLSRTDAVELFTQRALAIDPAFQLADGDRAVLGQLADRMDGLPLAMELAAARVHVLGLSGLVGRLEGLLDTGRGAADRPARHQTLRAAIQWSYDLLGPTDTAALRSLGVFAGGFTLDAAEALAGPDALEAVVSLVDKSLLTKSTIRGEIRFSMLDSIRRFSLEQLASAGETAHMGRLHAEYFAALAEQARPVLQEEGQELWRDRMAAELDNLRAALQWSVEHAEPNVGLRTAGAAWRFFHRRGHLPEARTWLERLLALPDASPAARAEGLNGLAGIVYWQGDYQQALGLYQDLLEQFRALDEPVRVADTWWALSVTSFFLDDFEAGAAYGNRARTAYAECGVPEAQRRVLSVEAWHLWRTGRLEEALARWEEAHRGYREVRDIGEQLQTQVACAAITYQLGRNTEALTRSGAALEALVASDDVSGTVMALDFVCVIVADAIPAGATKLEGAATRLRTELGGGLSPSAVGLPTARSIARRTIPDPELDALWKEGRTLNLEDALSLARSLIAEALAGRT